MMCRFKFIFVFCIVIIFWGNTAESQTRNIYSQYEIDVETFMGMLDGIFSDSLIDEITYCLPDRLMICNFSVGDFSSDSLPDIVISYKDKTCPSNALKVMFLVNNKTFFTVASLQTFRWQTNPFDISFLIKNHTCLISHRLKEKWVFSSYYYKDNKLKLLSEEKY
jgi:hypothetical protein